MNGYTGKILRINLTDKSIATIPTSGYEPWVGGHGMGSAIFFDLVEDKTIDGLDPANVVTLMTSPLSGTLVPGGSSRTEVQAIGVQSHPIGWFTRSNFGGRFGPMLKMAGWDGMVIEGAAGTPVWIDIRDNDVAIRACDALALWGKDTWECQGAIWDHVASGARFGDWWKPGGQQGLTTQRPAVLAIGPAGESLSRMACLIHDAGNACGQGGFGAVWGSKKLKAISVIGTGSVHVHDPRSLMQTRLWQKENYAFDLRNLKRKVHNEFSSDPRPFVLWGFYGSDRPEEGQRPQACVGCHSGCRARYKGALGSEASCITTSFYPAGTAETQYRASDLLNRLGLNAVEVKEGLIYLRALHNRGVLGPGGEVHCTLDFNDFGSLEFIEQFLKAIAYREDDFGNDIADGFVRAAESWGRLEGDQGDLKTGLLQFPYWGIPEHGYDPRAELEWGYGSILGDRDINEHGFNKLFWEPLEASLAFERFELTAEELVGIFADKLTPYQNDPDRMLMLDYSTGNMYSGHMARLVAWHRHYTRFWKQSVLLCDFRWPDIFNLYAPDMRGSTGEAEPRYFKAVTGREISFDEGIELGRKIWNIDHAIWTLQGRHRDMVHFADYIYGVPYDGFRIGAGGATLDYRLPGRGDDGSWEFIDTTGRHIDIARFEEFKTRFYELEGWDPSSGYPTRSTLESLGLGHVADELEASGRLGQE